VRHGTKIEWTWFPGYKGQTWNPVAGCDIVSPGCTRCYAMSTARRNELMSAAVGKVSPYAGTTKVVNGQAVWTGEVRLVESALDKPLGWEKPRAIFVNSMSDLYHEKVSRDALARIFARIAVTPQHLYIIVTKRSVRMREYHCTEEIAVDWFEAVDNELARAHDWRHGPVRAVTYLPNVILVVSTEDQKRADERIPDLLATPAACRGVSYEPALGPIDFRNIYSATPTSSILALNALTGTRGRPRYGGGITDMGGSWPKLDWIIAGGESGPRARPAHPDWFRSVRDQCAAAGTAFFFKQWGSFGPEHPDWPRAEGIALANDGTAYDPADLAYPDGRRRGEAIRAGHDQANLSMMYRQSKGTAGCSLDGREYNEFPSMENAA